MGQLYIISEYVCTVQQENWILIYKKNILTYIALVLFGTDDLSGGHLNAWIPGPRGVYRMWRGICALKVRVADAHPLRAGDTL